MRRSLIISSVLAAVAILGACSSSPANNGVTNNGKPAATATPVATASPVASPVASPSASPVASPGKTTTPVNVNKATPEKKPAETPKK